MAMFRFAPSTLYSLAATLMSAVVVPASMDVAANGLGGATPDFIAASGAPAVTPVAVQSGSGQNAPSATVHAKHASVDRVEARIAELHKQLKITDAQREVWTNFTQVMRENAQTVRSLADQRNLNQKTMSAVDDLNSYEAITEAHAEGLKKLVPAFRALYDAMSPEQNRNADAVFSRFNRRVASNTTSAMPSSGTPKAKP
jgi:LTXXQ motif family protein